LARVEGGVHGLAINPQVASKLRDRHDIFGCVVVSGKGFAHGLDS
jgi:hypothetical protein